MEIYLIHVLKDPLYLPPMTDIQYNPKITETDKYSHIHTEMQRMRTDKTN